MFVVTTFVPIRCSETHSLATSSSEEQTYQSDGMKLILRWYHVLSAKYNAEDDESTQLALHIIGELLYRLVYLFGVGKLARFTLRLGKISHVKGME